MRSRSPSASTSASITPKNPEEEALPMRTGGANVASPLFA